MGSGFLALLWNSDNAPHTSPSPLPSCCEWHRSARRPFSGRPAARTPQRQPPFGTSHHKGPPELWTVLFPCGHLWTNQVGLGGWGSHALHILELIPGSAWKGQPSLGQPCQQIQQWPHVQKSSGKVPKLCAQQIIRAEARKGPASLRAAVTQNAQCCIICSQSAQHPPKTDCFSSLGT